jgi:DNA (cytosine-5)-methyltransferase 1
MLTQRPLFDASPCPDPVVGWTALEFFAGVGLARCGLERAGWEVVFSNDLDPAKRRMHDGHFGPTPHYLLRDVHELAGEPDAVPDALLAHASFPCTDLSLAGGRRGLDAGQSSAFWGWTRLLGSLGERRPPLVLVENVVGLLSSHGGADFTALVGELNHLGYAVDAMMVDAAHFTPQSRPRLFVVGVAADRADRSCCVSLDELQPSTVRPAKLLESIRANRDADWALYDLPEPPAYGATALESIVDRDLADDDPQWWSDERADYLLNQMSPRHRAEADRRIAAKKVSYATVFRRVRLTPTGKRSMAELRTDGLAGCLRTPKGGSGRQILFVAGRGRYQVRLLNAQECARLMGAGDYNVTVPLNQALFGFGDAVSVDAVAWVAEHRLNPEAERLVLGRRASAQIGREAGASDA